jgi:predicted RNase H-like nuclease (RuvC/YqgF family)
MVNATNVIIGISVKQKNMHSEYRKDGLIPKANLLVSQFRSENETWNRTLESLTEEDVNLKMRLSEILKNMDRDDGLLERIEHFHNRLLKINESIAFLRSEVSKIEKQLFQDFFINTEFFSELRHCQKKIRKDMEIVEFDFHILKFDLNNFIGEILQA